MRRLILSSLVIGLVVLAVTGFAQRSPNVQYLNFPGSSADLPFSHVVVVGDTLYMGASSGLDPATGAPPPDIQDEARMALDGLKARLALGGMTMILSWCESSARIVRCMLTSTRFIAPISRITFPPECS